MQLPIPDFRPHPLLRDGHMQTLAGVVWFSESIPYRAVKHEITMPDGDRIVLHDDQPPEWLPGGPVALMLHGLGGSYASPYMVRIAAKLQQRGMRTFRMDMRGCGAGYLLAQGAGHAGRSEDVAAALERVATLCPGSRIAAFGFSLGGNLLLKLLGEVGDRIPVGLERALAVAPPIDLNECSRMLELAPRRFYNRAFLRQLMRQVQRRRSFVRALADIPDRPRPRSLYEFDQRFTAPLSGFGSAEEYYTRSSSSPLLPQIRVPTQIFAAADDPLIPVRMFESAIYSDSTQLVLTEHGGHLGYIGAAGFDPDRRWIDWRILEWVSVILGTSS